VKLIWLTGADCLPVGCATSQGENAAIMNMTQTQRRPVCSKGRAQWYYTVKGFTGRKVIGLNSDRTSHIFLHPE
jgi:hypothetical protein